VVLTFVALLILALNYLGKWLKRLGPQVNRDSYEQLVTGMEEKEVRKILGKHSRVDNRAVPRLQGTRAYQVEIRPQDYPRRFFWQEGDNYIWADIRRGRVLKFGALLDGERFGEDPAEHPVDEKPEKAEGEGE
jgi:hypothetical protein